jgi:hypothetical protein
MADKFRQHVQRTAQILREKLWRVEYCVPRTQRKLRLRSLDGAQRNPGIAKAELLSRIALRSIRATN